MSTWKKVHVEDANTTHGTITATLTDDATAVTSGSYEMVVYGGGAGTEQELKTRTFTFGSNAFNSTSIPAAANNATITLAAGSGLTGGESFTTNQSGAETITFNVVGGDGITANDDEIEVTVDDSTIELSASDGSGAVRVKALGIDTAQLAADAVNGDKIADDAIDSEHYVAGSIDEEHLNVTNSPTDNYILSFDQASGGFTWIANTASANDNEITLTAGDGVTGGGAFTVNQGSDEELTFAVQAADNTISVGSGGISVNEANLSGIPNTGLANDSVTVGSTEIDLGTAQTSIAGLTGLDFTAASASIAASIGSNTLTIGGAQTTVTIAGDLQVTGTLETITETELQVVDKNITLAQGSSTAAAATGGGIIIDVSTDANYSEDPAILFRADTGAAAFSEFEMVKGKTAAGDNAFIAGMVEAANYSALDALAPGIGTFGMVGGALYVQTGS